MIETKKLTALAKKIRVLLLDIDGVMTDGKLYFSAQGDTLKTFNTQDGLGLKMLMASGIKVGIISGRTSDIVVRRAEDLGISLLYQGQIKKLTAFEDCQKQLNIPATQIAYMGDDINDLPVLNRVGLRVAPSNARPEVKKIVHYVTKQSGGDGAVRELCELLLRSQNLLKQAYQYYGA